MRSSSGLLWRGVVDSMERYLEGKAYIKEIWTLAEVEGADDPVGPSIS